MSPKLRVLFVSLTNDIGSDRLVSEFGRHGAVCGVLARPGAYSTLSRFVARKFLLPHRLGAWGASLGLARRLAGVVAAWRPDRIIPLDELAALAVRTVALSRGTKPAVRDLIVGSLGAPSGYAAACHRMPLMELAAGLGVRVPEFCAGTLDAAGLPFPLVLKRDHSSGSGGVAAAHNPAELATRLKAFRKRQFAKTALARLAGYGHRPGPMLIQRHVEGVLAMHSVVCRDGQVLDGISFEAVQIHPTKGSSTKLRVLDNNEMANAARTLAESLGCSGFVSFDFLLDDSGRAYLIEMNPRPIGSTHLARLFGHDLCHAFLTGQAARPTSSLDREQVVALFPKELERDPDSSCLDRGAGLFHDVPADEPAIVNAYLDHLAALHPGYRNTHRSRLGQASSPELAPGWPMAGMPAH